MPLVFPLKYESLQNATFLFLLLLASFMSIFTILNWKLVPFSPIAVVEGQARVTYIIFEL